MKMSQINCRDWQAQLDIISQKLDNRNINIEVIGFDLGDQILAESVRLRGLTYNPRYDSIQITSDQFEHHIQSPSQIYVTGSDGKVESIDTIEIVDSEDRIQILTFEAPLLLEN